MNLKNLKDYIDYYKKNKSDKTSDNIVISWLEKFLQDPKMAALNKDEEILTNFLSYLKANAPDIHKKVFFSNKEYFETPTQLWELLCLSGEPTAVSYLILNKIIDKNTNNSSDMNAVHLTALAGNKEGMTEAINQGITPKHTAKGGFNLLHFAACSGDVASMQLALNQGIDPKSKSDGGVTILHLAAWSGSISAMDKAVELGVNPEDKDKYGNNVLDYVLRTKEAFSHAQKILPMQAQRYDQRIPWMPGGQQWFIGLMRNLGYQGDEGVCFGVSHMALQAALAGEMDKFNSRFDLIQTYVNRPAELKNDIEEAKKAVITKKPLTELQEKLLDIQAFFDGIELYQLPIKSNKILNDTHSQRIAAKTIHPLLIPLKLEKNNGRIENILYFETSYEDKNIEDFLTKLKLKCESSNFPISVSLAKTSSKSSGHEINLSYDPNDKSWILVDANKLPSKKFDFNDINPLKNEINKSLQVVENIGKLKFTADIYVHNDNTKRDVIRNLKSEMRQEFVPKKKPRSLLQRINNFVVEYPLASALIAIAIVTGVIALSVLTAGAAIGALGALGALAGGVAAVSAGTALSAGVIAFTSTSKKNKFEAQKNVGNIADKLDEYIILEINGKKKRFGHSTSEEQITNREKFFDYMEKIDASKMSKEEKNGYITSLQESMYDHEKALRKKKNTTGIIFDIFKMIDEKIILSAATSQPVSSTLNSTALTAKKLGPHILVADKNSGPVQLTTKTDNDYTPRTPKNDPQYVKGSDSPHHSTSFRKS